jgi:hypothetical protein
MVEEFKKEYDNRVRKADDAKRVAVINAAISSYNRQTETYVTSYNKKEKKRRLAGYNTVPQVKELPLVVAHGRFPALQVCF